MKLVVLFCAIPPAYSKKKPRMVVHFKGSLADQWYWNATFSEFGSQWNDGYIDNQLTDGDMDEMMNVQLESAERSLDAVLHDNKPDEEAGVTLWFDEKEDPHKKSDQDDHQNDAEKGSHEHGKSTDEEAGVTLWFDEKEDTGTSDDHGHEAGGDAHGHDAEGGHDDHGGGHEHGGLAIAHKNDQSGSSFETLLGGVEVVPNTIRIDGKELPKYVPRNGSNNGGVLSKENAVKIDWRTARFLPGTKIPGTILSKMEGGDSGDIKGKGIWGNGRWTLEFSRKLVTKSAKDVQFSNLTKTYTFGVALWDNTHGHDHVWNTINTLKFYLPAGNKGPTAEIKKLKSKAKGLSRLRTISRR